jgi:hypothetical protein
VLAHLLGRTQAVALGEGRDLFVVIAGFAPGGFDVAHEGEVERAEPEIIACAHAMLDFQREHLARGAQVAVDVMAMDEHLAGAAVRLLGAAEECTHRELPVAGITALDEQRFILAQARGHQVVRIDAVDQVLHCRLYLAR